MIVSFQAASKTSRSTIDSYARWQKPASVMVWGGISANSRTNLIVVPTGVKINSKTYRELILDTEVKGFGRKNPGNTSWTFQQDGAPAHTCILGHFSVCTVNTPNMNSLLQCSHFTICCEHFSSSWTLSSLRCNTTPHPSLHLSPT